VIADARNVYGPVYYGCVVRIVNNIYIHVVHFTIVEKMSAIPTAALVTVPGISEAVVDASVETDDRSPISSRESIATSVPSPVAWRPEVSGLWRENPSSRHPIVVTVFVIPSPITRSPNIVVAGAWRLLVNRQIRRSEINTDAKRDLGSCGNDSRYLKRKNQN